MSRIKLKGIHRVKKRLADGTTAEYHYIRGGAQFWGPDSPFKIGSEFYIKAFLAAGRKKPEKNIPRFRETIIKFKQSQEFSRLAPRTKEDYNKWLGRIDEEFGDAPLKAFNDPKIRQKAFEFRDRWSGRQAQYAWQVLARVSSWAYSRRIIGFHHLRDGGVVYRSDRADIIWKPSDIKAVLDIAPDYVRHAFITAIETGLRPGDLIKLSENHIENTPIGRRIVIRTNKKKRIAAIPISTAMAEVLDAKPKDRLLILANSQGGPWSTADVSRGVKRWARKAGVDESLRLYDARGTACTKLLMAGLTVSQIALHMGWSIETAARMIETYAYLNAEETDAVLVKLSEFRK